MQKSVHDRARRFHPRRTPCTDSVTTVLADSTPAALLAMIVLPAVRTSAHLAVRPPLHRARTAFVGGALFRFVPSRSQLHRSPASRPLSRSRRGHLRWDPSLVITLIYLTVTGGNNPQLSSTSTPVRRSVPEMAAGRLPVGHRGPESYSRDARDPAGAVGPGSSPGRSPAPDGPITRGRRRSPRISAFDPSPDAVLAVLATCAAGAKLAEEKTKFGAKVSAPLLATASAMLLRRWASSSCVPGAGPRLARALCPLAVALSLRGSTCGTPRGRRVPRSRRSRWARRINPRHRRRLRTVGPARTGRVEGGGVPLRVRGGSLNCAATAQAWVWPPPGQAGGARGGDGGG